MEGPSKTSAGAASGSGIPEGPLVEILSRVDARSVCRFKCVSKGCRDLIADPAIRKRLRQAMQGLFVRTAEVEDHDFSLVDLTARSVPFSFSFLTEMAGIRGFFLLDSCNGLILFGHDRDANHASARDYFVCNPTTKEWLGVPACGSPTALNHTYLAFDPAVSPHFHLLQFQMPDTDMMVVSLHVYSSETGTWSQNRLEGQIDGLNEQGPMQGIAFFEQNEQGQLEGLVQAIQWDEQGHMEEHIFEWGEQGQLEGLIDEQNEQVPLEGLIDEENELVPVVGLIDEQNEQGQLVGQIDEQNEHGQLEGQFDEQNAQVPLEGQINEENELVPVVGQIDEQNEHGQLEGQIDEQNEHGQLEGQFDEQNEQGQLEGQIVEQNVQGQLEGWHNQFKLEVLDHHCAFVNGLLHLIVWGADREHILVLDIQGKARRVITVPGMADGSQLDNSTHYLGQSQGHLHCLTINSAHEIHDKISVWVLQDYDTEEWALKTTVNSLDVFGETEVRQEYFVVDIHQDSNVLFFFHHLTNKLIAYNMDRKEVTVLATFQESKLRGDFARYIPYFVESLALPNKQ